MVVVCFESESHVTLDGLEFSDPLPASEILRSKIYTITPGKIASFILTISETRRRQGPHPGLPPGAHPFPSLGLGNPDCLGSIRNAKNGRQLL